MQYKINHVHFDKISVFIPELKITYKQSWKESWEGIYLKVTLCLNASFL